MTQVAQLQFVTCECGASAGIDAKDCPICRKPLETRAAGKFNCKACKAELSALDQLRTSNGSRIAKGKTMDACDLTQVACPKCGVADPFDITLVDIVERLYAVALFSGGLVTIIIMIILFISGWRGSALWVFALWLGSVWALLGWRNRLRIWQSS